MKVGSPSHLLNLGKTILLAPLSCTYCMYVCILENYNNFVFYNYHFEATL